MRLKEIIENEMDHQQQIDDPFLNTVKLTDEERIAGAERKIAGVLYRINDYVHRVELLIQASHASNFIFGTTDFEFAMPMKGIREVSLKAKDTPENRKRSTVVAALEKQITRLYQAQRHAEVNLRNIKSDIRERSVEEIRTTAVEVKVKEEDIPKQLWIGRQVLDNPYFFGEQNRFAGHPAHNDAWSSGSAKDQYIALTKLLKKYNVAPFTIMYGSKDVGHNFAVIGGDGQVIWYKTNFGSYVSKGQVVVDGSNDLWVFRPKYKTAYGNSISWLLNKATEAKLLELFEPISEKKSDNETT